MLLSARSASAPASPNKSCTSFWRSRIRSPIRRATITAGGKERRETPRSDGEIESIANEEPVARRPAQQRANRVQNDQFLKRSSNQK